MSKEVLLDIINRKAEEQAEEIISRAQTAAKERLVKVEAELSKEYELKLAEVNAQVEQSMLGQKTLMRIDEKKSILSAKREIIDSIYDIVTKRILEMSESDYLKFIGGLIYKFAEDGDEVIICKKDENRITANWVNDRAFDMQISLNLSAERHLDSGGIILRGKRFDKNLTVSAIIEDAKSETESFVVNKLFG